ncbi:MAG: indole-3-glycerol phosphate synthase TrpC [Pseudomonadota bacterium]|nr:indole-3-glycerol phosphate synthase TrpC [Pseudomonadota bacterium]
MSDALKKICNDRLAFYTDLKKSIPLKDIEEKANNTSSPIDFVQQLERYSSNGYALIAEIKRASPSAGFIRPDLKPEEIAKIYENSGAACLSILTEEKYFKGSSEDLIKAKKSSLLPVLRKDFMLDPYQIFESRAIGADCILLILACLSDAKARELESISFELGMSVILEVHDEDELERSLKLNSRLIGINNRNLKTLKTDLNTTAKLSKMVPKEKILISESGIKTNEELKTLSQYGASCFLIGEYLLKQNDIGNATKKILNG